MNAIDLFSGLGGWSTGARRLGIDVRVGTQLMLVDGNRARILNPGDLARFMGWRDYEISLPKQRKEASQLIGNAISVDVAFGVIGQALGGMK